MKTTIESFPTEVEKHEEFLRIQRHLDAHRPGDFPSFTRYAFRKSHDGIVITPINANHFGCSELSNLIRFCTDRGYTFGVHVAIGGRKSPSFEINMCKD